MEVKVGKVYVNTGMYGYHVLVIAVADRLVENEKYEKLVVYKNLEDGTICTRPYEEFTRVIRDANKNKVDTAFKNVKDEMAIARKKISKRELKLFEKVAEVIETKEDANSFTK